MSVLLDDYGDKLEITEEVVKTAARNQGSGAKVLALLLEERGDEIKITKEVVKAAAENVGGENVLALLLEKRGDEVKITQEVTKAAVENWGGENVLALLLEKRGDEVKITEEVVEAASGSWWGGQTALALLLEKQGDNFEITEKLVALIAGGFEERIMALLLEKRGSEVIITEEVVKAAAGNWRGGEKVLALLLEKQEDNFEITENLVSLIAGKFGERIMALLLEKRGSEIKITEEVVKAAAGNEQSGMKVVKAAAGNQQSGKSLLHFLLHKRGDEVKITEEVVKAAAGNQRSGESLLALFLQERVHDIMITEGVLKAAAANESSGKRVLTLLETSHDGMGTRANNEHIWIRKLQGIGYSLQEIANLLLDEVIDSPWIYFEPSEIARFVVQPNRHVPRCSHHYCSDQRGLLEGSQPCLSRQGSAADDFEVIEIIEELCGLAGISPTTRTKSGWLGSVEFNEENQLAAVSYTLATDETRMLSADRLWSRIYQALEKLCCAAGLIQARNLCCNSFTFLRLQSENHEAPAKILGEVVRVDFQLIVDLAEAVRSAQDPASEKSVDNKLLAASEAILLLVSPIITNHRGVFALEWSLQLCALAVQFLCLGFLSFTKAHIGAIHPFFLDAPLRQVILQGVGKEEDFPYIVAELVELTCLGGMTRGPVLMFHAGKNLAQFQDPEMATSRQNVGQCDILGGVEDVLDTWGPGNFVFRRDMRGPPVAVKIGDGFIFANKSGKCHWARAVDDVTDLGYINLKEPLLIGAFVTTNTNCSLVKAECWKKSSHVLEYLGTMPSSWAKSQQQVTSQFGQYVVGQLAQTWNKQRGIAVKEMVLSNPDNEQLIQFMDEYWGVQVSYCTGVARRVLLRTLVADLIPSFSKDLCLECAISKLRDQMLKPGELQAWLQTLGDDLREKFLKMVRKILDTLRPTGVDPTGKSFCVAWPFEGDTSRCFKIPIERHSTWVRILSDSQDCATFAYITMDCLETDCFKCSGSPDASHSNISVLATAVIRPLQEKLKHSWTLKHEEVYFFSELDSMFWVKVRREHTTRPAILVELLSVHSIPHNLRRRLYLSQKKKQQARLRECHTALAPGEPVSVFSTHER
ncbi:hypothetical protein CNMCM8980_003251 [Aspergillus fumigatiaffinis]|nr:hypothetical protein CNMCM8980_003251 [Aspergillus fumigatiaffinis]